MTVINGKSVCAGIAIGIASVIDKNEPQIKQKKVKNIEKEKERFIKAKEECILELKALYEKAVPEIGDANAQVFEIHQMMANDKDYCEAIESIIQTQGVNAEYAVFVTGENFAEMFSSMDDAYMKERASDVKDVSSRIVNILLNIETQAEISNTHIVIAEDLAPSETVTLDKEKVLAFVTEKGSTNSHTAIIAKSLNIPAVINAKGILNEKINGKEIIVDGYSGRIYIEPDLETLASMRKRQEDDEKSKLLLQELKGKETVTKNGRRIKLYANISGIGNVGEALKNDAEGIGLFRSEFIFLESKSMPSEEKQFEIYKKVLESMGERKVIVRTLDIGADKNIDYLEMKKEENPALGLRGIRLCLVHRDIMKAQLRALYRASVYGNLSIMFPMIISVDEIKKIKEITEEVKAELRKNRIPFAEKIETGIMIETPASAMISDILAPMVDFFSIGTNDLIQYTLAIDRQNPTLDEFLDLHHPAVLRLIDFVCQNAHNNGAWVGICGELGADISLTKKFLKSGVDELSVSPSQILKVRKQIRSIDTSKADYDI